VVGISGDGTEVSAAAVVVACGGLGNASRDILQKYWPDACRHGDDWHYYIGVETDRGDAIKLSEDVGAEIGGHNAGLIVCASRYHGAVEGPPPGWPVFVNLNGRRFMNELLDYSVFGHNVNRQPERRMFGIFDHDAFTRTPKDPRYRFKPIFAEAPGYAWQTDKLAEGLAAGKVISAPTLRALAEKTGIAPETFVATMEEYNRDARAGRDTHFLKDAACMIPVEKAPFYALERRVAENDLSCVGMRINARAQVYAKRGLYVPGLYAAGEASSGVFNHYVASGNSIANCVIFGRTAGRNAAAERLA